MLAKKEIQKKIRTKSSFDDEFADLILNFDINKKNSSLSKIDQSPND